MGEEGVGTERLMRRTDDRPAQERDEVPFEYPRRRMDP